MGKKVETALVSLSKLDGKVSQMTSEEGDDFGTWIELFLNALIEQSRQSIELIDSLFANPFVRKADVAEICGVHPSTAGKIVNSFVGRSVLAEISGRKRNQMFVCDTTLGILNSY